MKIALSAETTLDLTKELLKEWDIHTIPFHLTIGEKEFYDGEILNEEIFKLVKEEKQTPKTSAVNKAEYDSYFTSLLNNGYDAIIHISLSSNLSSAYINACASAEELKNVYVINSSSLSTGIALLCYYARTLINAGDNIESIIAKIQSKIDKVQASFILYTLEYLYKGGRCGLLALFGANLLHIRPQILVKDGKMVVDHKFIGDYTKCVSKYVASTLEKFNHPDKSLVFITYSSYNKEIVSECRKSLEEKGFERIEETFSGATITSHCGENCIGILYINDGE